MNRRLTTKEVTFVRFLSDSLAANPSIAIRIMKEVMEVLEDTRDDDDDFIYLIQDLQKEILESPGRLRRIATDWFQDEDHAYSRVGECLMWSLRKHGRMK